MNIQKKKRKTPKDFFKSLEEAESFVCHLTASNTFKKDIDLCYRRNLDLDLLETAVVTLARGEKLDKNIAHISYTELQNNIAKIYGNVTYNLIGF